MTPNTPTPRTSATENHSQSIVGEWYESRPYGEQVPRALPLLAASCMEAYRDHDEYAMRDVIHNATADAPWTELFEYIFDTATEFADEQTQDKIEKLERELAEAATCKEGLQVELTKAREALRIKNEESDKNKTTAKTYFDLYEITLEEREERRKQLEKAREALRELFAAGSQLHAAMIRYEGDVDTEAPSEHRRMMERAESALAKAKEVAGI